MLKDFPLLFCFGLILSGCTPQKRFSRLIDRHPHLIQEKTETKTDTILKGGFKFDTVLISGKIDTFTIIKEGFKFKIIRSFDTMRINVFKTPDTVFRTQTILKKYITPAAEKKPLKTRLKIFFVILGVLAWFILFFWVRKFFI